MTGPCKSCIKRWYGWFGNKVSEWHCRKDLTLPVDKLPVIGNDQELKAALGCKHWDDK